MVARELITLLGYKLDDGPQQKYNKQIDDTKARSNSLANAARGVGIAWKIAAAAVAVGVGWVSKNIIAATVKMEEYRTQMEAFTGSAESAAETLAELRKKTIDPLFGTGNLVNSYKQLRTIGMGAEETSKMIDVLGDVANGSAENFNALNNIMLKVGATGKVNGGTMRMFAQAGFGAQDMAQGLGISVERLNADLEVGKIGFKELTKALENSTKEGGRFYMNAANQALTLGGSIKILKDAVMSMGDAIGTKVAPALAKLIGYVTKLIKLGRSDLVEFGANAFRYLIHVIAQIIIFFEVLQMRMRKFGGAFTPLKALFKDVFDFLGSVIASAQPFLMNLATLFLVAFKPIQAFVKPILEALKPIIHSVFGFMSEVIERLIPNVDGLTPVFGSLGWFIGKLIGPILGVAAAIKGVNMAISIGKGVVSGIKAVQTAYGLLSGTMSVMKAAADGNRLAMLMLDAQMLKSKITTIAHTIATKAAGLVTKIWSGIQAIFNAIMAANPIALIIIGVVALITAIVLLVKNWDKVTAALKRAWDWFKNLATLVKDKVTGAFNALPDTLQKGIKAVLAYFTIISGPIGILLNVIRNVIKQWGAIKDAFKTEGIIGGFKKLGSVIFNAVIEPFKAIYDFIASIAPLIKEKLLIAIAAFAERFPNLYQLITEIAAKFKAVFGKIKTVIMSIINVYKTAFTLALGVIKQIGVSMINVFKTIFTSVFNVIKTTFTAIQNVIKAVFTAIKNNVIAVLNVFKTIFTSIWKIVKGVFTTIFDTVFSIFDGLIGIWRSGGNIFVKIWESIKLVFTSIWKAMFKIVSIIADAFGDIWNSVKQVFITAWQGIKDVFSTVWKGITSIVFSSVEGIKNIAMSIAGAFSDLWDGIKNAAGKAWDGIKNIASGAWDKLKNFGSNYIDNAKQNWKLFADTAGSAWDSVKNVTGKAWEGIKSGATKAGDFLKNNWKTITIGMVNPWAGGLKALYDHNEKFRNFVDMTWGKIKDIAGAVWDKMPDGVKDIFIKIKNIISGAIEKIKSVLNGIKEFFSGLWEALKQGPSATIEYLINSFWGLVSNFKAVFANFKNIASGIWDGIKNITVIAWDKIRIFFISFVKAINILFTALAEKIKQVFQKTVDKAIGIWNKLKQWFKNFIEVIKGIWASITGWFSALWEGIVNTAMGAWSALKSWFSGLVDGIKNIWNGVTGFFAGLWDGVINSAMVVWGGIKNYFINLADGIKNIWNGIVSFFSGLWEAIKQGPSEALDYIKNAFFGLFDNIKEKFFGFINIIKEGWEKVKNFFGGAVDFVVNTVTGGDKQPAGKPAKQVDDLILTPSGGYSTHPDDYIMAMKQPGDLIDKLMRFLSGPQPAYAGAGGGGSLMGNALSKAATQNTYNHTSTSNESHVSAPINVNVNASGMSPEMASAAVKNGIRDALNEAINGSRGSIPSPEARRN